MEKYADKFHSENLYDRYERREREKNKRETRERSLMFEHPVAKGTPATDPDQPTSEDDSDTQFIAIKTDKEFPKEKNLRER